MEPSLDRLRSLELHDSRLEDIHVSCDGGVEFRFRHISGFVHLDERCTEVWSFAVSLALFATSRFAIEGSLAKNDYVTEGALRDAVGGVIELAALVDRAGGPGRLELLFAGSGTVIRAAFGRAQVVNCQPRRLLEATSR